MNIIETKNLSFNYKKQQVLNKLELQIPTNSIYGYLGKNGAGKTTTIKLLLGLIKSTKESIFFDGKDFNYNRISILENIGNLIETPCYYANLTALENLNYLNIIFRRHKNRIEEVLQLVNLIDAKNKKVKYFSTGMKQRLGIAMAVFHNPQILILDEPLNGLDPEGIHSIRELIKRLHSEGKTIFLSSHILSELDKISTHIGILDKGELIYQGSKDSLLAKIERNISLRVNNIPQAISLCKKYSFKVLDSFNEVLSITIANNLEFNKLLQLLINSKIEVYSVDSQSADLESVFLNLTS